MQNILPGRLCIGPYRADEMYLGLLILIPIELNAKSSKTIKKSHRHVQVNDIETLMYFPIRHSFLL